MKQQGSGTIINISSVAGHIPLPFHAVYSATKFAMNAFGKAANVELKGSGIHVMTVCPGYVRTDFGANAVRGREAKTVRPVLGPRNQRPAGGSRRDARLPETEAGSSGALDNASRHQGLSVVSRPWWSGRWCECRGGQNKPSVGWTLLSAAFDFVFGLYSPAITTQNQLQKRRTGVSAPHRYCSSVSMPSISDWAWLSPVRFAEAIPSANIFRASSALRFGQGLGGHEVAGGVVGMGRQQPAKFLQRPLDVSGV